MLSAIFSMGQDTAFPKTLVGLTPLVAAGEITPYQEPAWHFWAIIFGVPFLTLAGLALGIYIGIRREERRTAMVMIFLLISGMSMGQGKFTARTWESMDRAIYKQQRQIDTLLVRTAEQDRFITNLTRQQLNSEVRIFEVESQLYGIQQRLDSLIKDLRVRPPLRVNEGSQGWPERPQFLRPQMMIYDSVNHIFRIINESPVTFYSSRDGDSLFWGRDHSFSRGFMEPLSGQGYDSDLGAAKDPPPGCCGDQGARIEPPVDTVDVKDFLELKGTPHFKKRPRHHPKHKAKKKIKVSPRPNIDFSHPQGSPVGKPSFSGITLDTLSSRNGMQIYRIHPEKKKP